MYKVVIFLIKGLSRYLAPLFSGLFAGVVSLISWLSNKLVSGVVVAYLTTYQAVKVGMAWLSMVLVFSTISLNIFTLLANLAFFFLVFEFISFSIDLFNQITDLLNNGSSGSVTLHGVSYNILDNFFAVLDLIGFTDAFNIVKPLLLSFIVFSFTYIARKYFIELLNVTTKKISDLLGNLKVDL